MSFLNILRFVCCLVVQVKVSFWVVGKFKNFWKWSQNFLCFLTWKEYLWPLGIIWGLFAARWYKLQYLFESWENLRILLCGIKFLIFPVVFTREMDVYELLEYSEVFFAARWYKLKYLFESWENWTIFESGLKIFPFFPLGWNFSFQKGPSLKKKKNRR